MILIGSRANPELNQLVSTKLGIELTDCQLGHFSNGETQIGIGVSVRGHAVYVISTGCAPVNDHLMETLMICKACKTSNAESITLILANFPYARQDKKTRSRECLTASFIAEMIEIAGVDRVITFDLHSEQIQGMLRIPLDNIRTYKLFGQYLKSEFPQISPQTHIVVAPDAGATKRCRNLALQLGVGMALIEKSRNYNNGDQIEKMILIDENNSVKGKIVFIYDDIGDTLGTLCKACTLLQEAGAKEVVTLATHGCLSGPAIHNLNQCQILTKAIFSNTIPIDTTLSPKLMVCDISDSICTAIDCLEKKTSMSIIFD